MPNEKSQISLTKKRIFLVKIQVMIYFLCIVAVIFGAYYFGNDFVIKFQFFKIYFLFFILISFCKTFYFDNIIQSKNHMFILFLNLLSLCYLYIIDENIVNISFFLLSIFLFLFTTYLMYKFLKSISKKALFKSFLYINFSVIFMFILHVALLYDKYSIKTKEPELWIVLVWIIIYTILPLSFLLSIPLNLISEYRYFKKELNKNSNKLLN
ncbi:putative membrane protein [Campylobacter ureolyticus RIGS 9880]|uniref:Membrane protein n=2 Tax=Campylobacter ureolyticus TaxID=827 RepID=A0AAU8U108_9BACT|nr:putative membrane protein [Campylobacter ureolyticus RIGS 9880]